MCVKYGVKRIGADLIITVDAFNHSFLDGVFHLVSSLSLFHLTIRRLLKYATAALKALLFPVIGVFLDFCFYCSFCYIPPMLSLYFHCFLLSMLLKKRILNSFQWY